MSWHYIIGNVLVHNMLHIVLNIAFAIIYMIILWKNIYTLAIDEWRKRRASGQISDLDDQYGDPKKIGGIPLPMASFGVGGEFGVGGKFDNGGECSGKMHCMLNATWLCSRINVNHANSRTQFNV